MVSVKWQSSDNDLDLRSVKNATLTHLQISPHESRSRLPDEVHRAVPHIAHFVYLAWKHGTERFAYVSVRLTCIVFYE
jgi:hypothetical protein